MSHGKKKEGPIPLISGGEKGKGLSSDKRKKIVPHTYPTKLKKRREKRKKESSQPAWGGKGERREKMAAGKATNVKSGEGRRVVIAAGTIRREKKKGEKTNFKRRGRSFALTYIVKKGKKKRGKGEARIFKNREGKEKGRIAKN